MDHGSFQPEQPTLIPVDEPGKSRMSLQHPFQYTHRLGDIYGVEEGYITDGASIPRFFWLSVGHPFQSQYLRAAIIHDKLCDLADESATKPERQQKRAKADLVFHTACLCCGCDRALAQKLLVGVRIGALFLPWKRKTAEPQRGEMRSAEPSAEKGEEELLALWQEACEASAGLKDASREGTPMRGPTREGFGELTLEDLEQIDATILGIAVHPNARD
jgi:hypothetical protein